jgi:protein AATF/BFR2
VVGSDYGMAEDDELSQNSREQGRSVEEEDATDISSGSDEENDEPLSASQNVSLNKPPQDHLDDLTSTLQKTREEDRKKGKAISQQIVRCACSSSS